LLPTCLHWQVLFWWWKQGHPIVDDAILL